MWYFVVVVVVVWIGRREFDVARRRSSCRVVLMNRRGQIRWNETRLN